MKTIQLQQNKPNIPNWVLYLLIIIFLIFLAGGFTGCTSINKATQKVLTNQAAFNNVGAAWAKLNPCVVDSTKTLVHATTFKTDTTYNPLAPAATSPGGFKHEPVNADDVSMPPFMGWERGTVAKTITNTITVHDSVKIVSVDKRVLGLYADSINYYKLVFANYKADAIGRINGLQRKANVRLWLIVGIIALMLGYIFRKPLLALITGGAPLLTKIL